MKKNGLVLKNSGQLALTRTKELLGITRKILAPENSLATSKDMDWMDRLWAWADANGLDEKKIPRKIRQLVDLTYLNLKGSKLTEIPGEIGQLTKLTGLTLSDNRLTGLPKEIWQLTQLTWLDLRGNQLTELPKEIRHLKQLTWLDLSGNQLVGDLPEGINSEALIQV